MENRAEGFEWVTKEGGFRRGSENQEEGKKY